MGHFDEEARKLKTFNNYTRLLREEKIQHQKAQQKIIDRAFEDKDISDYEFELLCDYALGKKESKENDQHVWVNNRQFTV